ncbi:unnamed protein product [Penicillium camemberti]|uniref:Str. FM013 n=1 Tax=Penicillium camemberti (strain FM 013) TaxID=1429867 RepID=A0A0G4PGJ0_PENC3|nr:unnamed protein product [Penicillium camemberti]
MVQILYHGVLVKKTGYKAKMAWESDAAKMTLVSNDQKPHFMTWDGVAG